MRVLVVDDDINYRSVLRKVLTNQEGIDGVSTAINGRIALQKLEQSVVDVVVLDGEMPEMDGLQAASEIRKRKFSVKIIILKTGGSEGLKSIDFDALVDGSIEKPKFNAASDHQVVESLQKMLLPMIRKWKGKGKFEKDKAAPLKEKVQSTKVSNKGTANFLPELIVIGSSTGGPAALETVFTGIGSENCPPILIAQHMPPGFTKMLADRISKVSHFTAVEGESDMVIKKGHVYVAPGDFHMVVARDNEERLIIKTNKDPKVNSVRPAVDVLFKSVAVASKRACVGIILTGMGEDGCIGVHELRKCSRSFIFIQNEKSCVVWGMPRAVYASGDFDSMGDLGDCQELIKSYC